MSVEDKQNSSELDLKKTISELNDRVSMIESISADRITELEKVLIELNDRIRQLEWRNWNF